MSLILGVCYILVIGAVTVSMAVLLLMGKKESYNKMYFGCQGMVVLWCVSQIMILLSHTQLELSFSYLLGNAGVCFVGACWFGFAAAYGRRRMPALAGGIPFLLSGIHYLFVLTNDRHYLYYTSFSKDVVVHGPLFYTNVAETYLFVAAGAVILYQSIGGERDTVSFGMEGKKAKVLIIAAVLVPVVFNLFYLTGIIRASFDITPLGFGISGILVLLATIKYRFMEVNITAFDTVLSGLSEGVAIFDENGKCTYYNKAFLYVFLKEEQEALEEAFFLNPEGVRRKIEAMQHLEENVYVDDKARYFSVQVYQNPVLERDKFSDDRRGMKKQAGGFSGTDMVEVPFLEMQAGRPAAFVLRDVTRYYTLLHQTQELAVTNERLALEKERNRIAQQVHDTAGHTLTMIQSYMKMAAVANEKQESGQVQGYLEDARELTSSGIRELRESINQLRRGTEKELVTQGILQLADQVKEIAVEVTVQGEDSERYSCLYRTLYDCMRECITNTLKYADAKKVDVVLHFREDCVELTIADDGRGCADIRDNNGLTGIRQRVGETGGTVRFLSGENEGFLTRIQIPVRPDNAVRQFI